MTSTEKEFYNVVKGLALKQKNVTDKDHKLKWTIKLLEYIVKNKHIINDPRHIILNHTLLKKLLEFRANDCCSFNVDKYINVLYPEFNLNISNQHRLQESTNLLQASIGLQEYFNTPFIIDNYIGNPQFFKPVQLIFDDYKINKITDKAEYTNMTFIDAIITNISTKYEICDLVTIANMVKSDKTVEQVRKDCTYTDGVFLIKLSEYMYELYEKHTNVTHNEGYLYNSTSSTIVINKLGKYCLISL
jgi:hypothetical protein